MGLVIEDDGFLQLTLKYEDGTAKEFKVDVFDLYNRLVDACADVDATGGWTAYNTRRQDTLEALGYGKISTAAVVKLGDALVEYVDRVKKKDSLSASAATPSSTDSPSSNSAIESTLPV